MSLMVVRHMQIADGYQLVVACRGAIDAAKSLWPFP